MLKLVVLPGAFGMRNISPFCLKMEMLLTALDVPFEMVEEADPRKAPKGKLPYLIDGDEVIADSELMVHHVDKLTQGRVFEGHSAEEHAIGLSATRLAEEHLYWGIVASRWLDEAWWPNVVEGFFHIAPKPVRGLVAGMARKQVRKTYDLQGLGRHSPEEQRGFFRRDLDALQALVSSKPFLLGDTPTVHDFAVAGILAGLFDNQPATWITRLAEPYTELKAYADRVQETVGVWGRK